MSEDVIVVGGSFAGLSAAMQLARARRRVLVIDSGKPRNRFAAASHGFFGQDGRPPAEMMVSAREQLLAYPTVRFIAGDAVQVTAEDGEFAVGVADGAIHRAARLILATGMVDELPPLPGLAERWGISVLHCPYCHGYEFAGEQLGVLATAPSIHLALLLPDWGPTTLFTNGSLELDSEQLAALDARGVTVERTPVVAIEGESPTISNVRLEDGRAVPIDALFTAPRTHLAGSLFAQLGCDTYDGPTGPMVRIDELSETSVPGVFAAGDAVVPMPNATLAAASGVKAGAATHRSLVFPRAA